MKITRTIKSETKKIQTLADVPSGKIFLTRSPLDSDQNLRFRDGDKVYIFDERCQLILASAYSLRECVVTGVATGVNVELDTTGYDG